jgi:hypothetical protein
MIWEQLLSATFSGSLFSAFLRVRFRLFLAARECSAGEAGGKSRSQRN